MNSYNIYVQTETEKYEVIQDIRDAGAILTGVSGCGTGYYSLSSICRASVAVSYGQAGGRPHSVRFPSFTELATAPRDQVRKVPFGRINAR